MINSFAVCLVRVSIEEEFPVIDDQFHFILSTSNAIHLVFVVGCSWYIHLSPLTTEVLQCSTEGEVVLSYGADLEWMGWDFFLWGIRS